MRHRKGNRKLSRPTDQRKALLRSLVQALFEQGKIKVTLARAKEARKLAEKIIGLSKYNDLHARRTITALLRNRVLTRQIFQKFLGRYEGRAGGFTRITKLGWRRGDAAPIALLELL